MIEKGKIQSGTERLSRGRKVMEANLKGAGGKVPKDWQVNHLIPDEIAQRNPLMIEALKRDLFNVDRASNLLPMPGKARAEYPDLIGHFGSHGNYNNLVKGELRREKTILIEKYGSLGKVPDNELKETVKGIEDAMREEIINRSSDIPTRYDPETKTRVLSEGISDPDFVV
jgi:A nuclease family of the HNH/ENDO VII superfamily with conserved AHH